MWKHRRLWLGGKKKKNGGRLFCWPSETAIHDCHKTKADLQCFRSVGTFVLTLNLLIVHREKKKKCVIQALASSSENINDSLACWLRGAHGALWALAGEALNMQSQSCQLAAGAPTVGTARSPCRYWHLQQDCYIPYAPILPTPASESRQPSSPEPEIRLRLIHTALYLLSISHYAPCCREERFSLLRISHGK